ncbi:MAG: hypothetical protein K2X27_15460 [Candidatus Obscuribacterales bacterium]|nr:hypothetical protein [Candidatus Obscuribacterales bacterium]
MKTFNKLKNNTRGKRKSNGNSIMELPAALWITLIVFFMPMMSLATITLRLSLLNMAVLEAVHSASKARSFEQSSNEGVSAVELANQTFAKFVNSFPGLGAGGVKLSILASSVNSGATTRFDNKLSQPANSSAFVYQIEGNSSGAIEPVFPISGHLFGNIPGLSSPLKISFTAKEFVENPQGLNR